MGKWTMIRISRQTHHILLRVQARMVISYQRRVPIDDIVRDALIGLEGEGD